MTKEEEIQVNNARATFCDITEAGDTPISMGIIPVRLYHRKPDCKIAVNVLLDNMLVVQRSLKKSH